MRLNILLILFVLFLLATQAIYAQDAANPQDARLTAMQAKLREFQGQLQDAQNQAVTLQAQVTQDEADKKALQDKVDALNAQLKTVSDQAMADKADMTKRIATLQGQTDDQKRQITTLTATIAQWHKAYDQTAQLAAGNEAARKQYAIQAALLQRTVDDREVKNLALYKLANEILTRYEKFGLGEALEAKEPFIGVTRVKLETLVQEYKDKILDQAVTSRQPLAPLPQPAPAPKSAANSAPPAVPAEPTGTSTASAKTPNSP
jgi:peptidoglycan hydrolase CwlO-like protein